MPYYFYFLVLTIILIRNKMKKYFKGGDVEK